MFTSEAANLTAVPPVEDDQHSDDEVPQSDDEAQTTAASPSEGRDRSSVVFPYDELGSAEVVARTIFENYGDRCSMDQLAGKFGQKTTSGAFRIKVTAARIFGAMLPSAKCTPSAWRSWRKAAPMPSAPTLPM